MLDFLGTLVWAGVACYGIWRFAPVLERFASVHADAPDDIEDVTIPDDLLAFASALKDEWAVEDTVKAIKERYLDLRDWNRVRSAMGIGIIPESE